MNENRSNFIAPRLGGVSAQIALHVRTKIFHDAMHVIGNKPEGKVLDIGVTSDRSPDSNFFESLYPYPSSITATGLEDASFLELKYPGLSFVPADACHLPFNDGSFDFAFCSAVIEHVGSRERQQKLISEAVRVADQVMITTPNIWFPLEFHTLTPLIHWLPPRFFRSFLAMTGRPFFSREENLNLLSNKHVEIMLRDLGVRYKKRHKSLFGIVSNLVYVVSRY